MQSDLNVRREPIPADFKVVAEDLQFPEGPNWMPDGTVVLVEVRGGTVSRVLPDGRIERLAHVGGGPNSCAVGPDGGIYVCNNGGYPWHQRDDGRWDPHDPATGSRTPEGFTGGWIERVDFTGAVERLYDTVGGSRLSSPCDLIFDSGGSIWFTDAGKVGPRSRALGGLYFANPDGSSITEAAYGLIGPNGVGLSPNGDRLFLADSASGRLWTWALQDGKIPGSDPFLHGGSVHGRLPGSMVLDSLAVDSEGRVIVAVVGGGALAVFEPDGGLWFVDVPDAMPTNVCFGGPDLQTAYVTLAGMGALATFRWQCPGLKAAFP